MDGKKITFRELRKGQGLSQTDIALMLGVSQKLVSEWERGIAPPKPYIYFAMAYVFGTEPDDITTSKANEGHGVNTAY